MFKPKVLSAQLQKVEGSSSAAECREDLVQATQHYGKSYYELGKALALYKKQLPHGSWLPVVRIIAKALGRSERSVREVFNAYNDVESFPTPVRDELHRQGIDPVAPKGRPVVRALHSIDLSDPKKAVREAMEQADAATWAAKERYVSPWSSFTIR